MKMMIEKNGETVARRMTVVQIKKIVALMMKKSPNNKTWTRSSGDVLFLFFHGISC